jgi:4-carboxymuconolactone decarboxylase
MQHHDRQTVVRPLRLPFIIPSDLTPAQRVLYDEMRAGMIVGSNTFSTERADGALTGPWNVSLHHPDIGKASWELAKAVDAIGVLPAHAKEIAILVVTGHHRAPYEIYAHVAASERAGMSLARIAAIVANAKPGDMTLEESVAFDVAYALCQGGPLSEPIWQRAVDAFGNLGASQLVYIVGVYSLVSMTLNGFNVPVPHDA